LKHISIPFPETIFICAKPFLTLRYVGEAYTTIAIFKQKKRRIFIFTLLRELIGVDICIIQNFNIRKYLNFVYSSQYCGLKYFALF
tara:strand:+ start:1473 stop:1730 length:258 start_codon:yes stop_codon:yes gene_type:complete